MLELEKRLKVAKAVAVEAGKMVLQADLNKKKIVKEKKANDFVTDFDSKSEKLIISKIKEHFPDDGFFGEETGKYSGKGRWVIDPIDGTVNFFRGNPNYSISIAYEEEKYKPLIGVVYNPRQDELFYASLGGGAYCNEKPIHVSEINDPKKAISALVAPHRKRELADKYFRIMRNIFDDISDYRSLGSAALECCYIAAGRIDCYFEYALGYYDIAAGIAILRESGGEAKGIEKGITDGYCDIIATNKLLTPWLEKLIEG